eukprot:TRINITY_DN2691_c0_g1_i2.p4 TRINITY_DN2691_c0_g1~~TRINITY_DN2691_c0_g1_i2.p4  ORF type:complete len:112 (+),score=16.97 TRINITY_DN2691_c0_g1_i2:80-415(+)
MTAANGTSATAASGTAATAANGSSATAASGATSTGSDIHGATVQGSASDGMWWKVLLGAIGAAFVVGTVVLLGLRKKMADKSSRDAFDEEGMSASLTGNDVDTSETGPNEV